LPPGATLQTIARMPLQNRVDPFSRIHAHPMRGLFTGNRGCLHDGEGRIVTQGGRQDAWVICQLSFRGRRRELMQPGRYTHLFFLDEATALAAGHRPCAECRRDAYNAYCEAILQATGRRPTADDLNRSLREEMRTAMRGGARPSVEVRDLPVGAMFADGEAAVLVTADGGRRWSFEGYGPPALLPRGQARALTPRLSLMALRGGYSPVLHPSAIQPAGRAEETP
jgi:hypothetical protein